MAFTRSVTTVGAILATALFLSGCSSPNAMQDNSELSGTINGAGATSQVAAQETWAAQFQAANPAVTVNYESSGSGAGREMFIAGGIVFAGSDAPLSDAELDGPFASCAQGTRAIDIPAYVSSIAIGFRVAGVSSLDLDAPTLAKIFSGTITKWDDPAIASLNPGVILPDATITAVHRSDDSGTTENFSDYLHALAPTEWAPEPSDTFPFQKGEGAQGTSGVVDAVKNGVNTIGYIDASRTAGLGVARIKVGEGFVSPTSEVVAATIQASSKFPNRDPHDFALDINRTLTEGNAYPLVLVSYIIACESYADASKAEAVRDYLTLIISEQGQQRAAQTSGSVPLSPALSDQLLSVIGTIG